MFPTKNLYGCPICRIPTTCPANLILLIRPPNNIVEEYNTWRWSWYGLLHSTASSPLLGPNTILRAYSNTLSLCVAFSGRDPSFTTTQTADMINITYILTFVLADSIRQDVTLWSASQQDLPECNLPLFSSITKILIFECRFWIKQICHILKKNLA